ncbi:MAG TPA: error-prone DNA polymerase [Patescibacteria group bacterium]|nr:error-prone DNA polymerase [Patescibacteria group bacterium]
MTDYVELQVTSNYSFLRGASHPDELFRAAFEQGYKRVGLADRNTLSGVVRAHVVARGNGMKLVLGSRLDLQDGASLLAYPTDRAAYGRLSTLLTIGKRRAPKGECHLTKQDVYEHAGGIQFIAVPPLKTGKAFEADMKEYRDAFGRNLSLAAAHYYLGDDEKRLAQLARLSRLTRTPLVATNDVHYHSPARRALQDVLTCIREKCTIDTAGYRLHENAERHIKPPAEMARLYRAYPEALKQSLKIAEACDFSLEELCYEYPHEILNGNDSPQEELVRLTWLGAAWRFPGGIPPKVKETIEKELSFIAKKDYAAFFLTVYDIVDFARKKKILCQGRGSAANSVVCFCLGITSVNPTEINLLFERFISDSRNEPPDIDVDFEHERREEVMQYVFEKYGRDRAGIVATVVQYRARGAVRDVGKAMGLSTDMIERIGQGLHHYTDEGMDEESIRAAGLDPADKRLRQMLALSYQLMGFPRHLSQHTGGFVITRGKLHELCPIMNAAMADRTCIEWDKDDIEAMRMLKVDVLALGMLSCVRACFDLLNNHHGREMTLATIPPDDTPTYDMICKADTIGVFQIESRAQMSMLPRLKPRKFYDLVIEVAIVRPGPIQGDMVHPYLRRREGIEKPDIPPQLNHILEKTLGVPLFQEQAMHLAIVAADFEPADADKLRRSMATFKSVGTINDFEKKLIEGMLRNNYPLEFAQRIYKQLEGFGSYGFPESHAASFALLVYVSSWIKCHYPDVFACALLNSQPMGFYAPAQIIRDAAAHGVELRAVDVNRSKWDNYLRDRTDRLCPIQLGFREVKGLKKAEMEHLVAVRGKGFDDVAALWQRGVSVPALETLARADAFRSMGLDRRQALWEVRALADKPATLFEQTAQEAIAEPAVTLPRMSASEHVVHDYATTSFSLKGHPVGFVRERLDRLEAVTAAQLKGLQEGAKVKLAGLVLVRQRPPTAKEVCFVTLEDETGTANLVVFKKVFDTYRRALLPAKLLMVEGKLQREGDVIHIVAEGLYDLTPWLRGLTPADDSPPPLLQPPHPRSQLPDRALADRSLPGSRDFH